MQGWDLIALRCDGDLSEDSAGGVVERSDEVRRGLGAGACSAHGLPVDGDDPASSRDRCSGPQVGAEDEVKGVGFQACERTSDGRLAWPPPRDAKLGQRVGRLVGYPLTDSDERPCSGQHRGQAHGQDRGEPVLQPAGVTGVRDRDQQAQQIGAGRRATRRREGGCGRR